MPRVSVVTPSYNHAPFLPARLNSITQQSLKEFEWIIVDDGSTDGSRDLLMAAAQRDQRIRLFLNDRNLGMAETVKKAIGFCRAPYIYRAESDDYCVPALLARMVDVLDANPNVGLAYCRARHMDETGRVWGGRHQAKVDSIQDGLAVFCSLVKHNFIPGSNMMFTRQAHDDVGGFGISGFQSSCDYHFNLRVCLKYDVAYIAEPLGYHRIHRANLSGRLSRDLAPELLFKEYYSVVLDVFEKIPPSLCHLQSLKADALRAVTLGIGAQAYAEALLARKLTTARALRSMIESLDPGGTAGSRWHRHWLHSIIWRMLYGTVYFQIARHFQTQSS